MEKFAKLKTPKPSEVCAGCEGFCEQMRSYGVSATTLLAVAEMNMELPAFT